MAKIECTSCGALNPAEASSCWKCKTKISQEQRAIARAEEIMGIRASDEEAQRREAEYQAEVDRIASIKLTTSYMVAGREIATEVGIVTAECVFGMNIFRDLFAGIRDIVGGRSGATQKVLRDARETVLNELRKEAADLHADAVIAVDLDYQELSGGGKGGMLMLVASGTAVKLQALP